MSAPPTPTGDQLGKICEHKRLARQCPECELQEEVRELRDALAQERAREAVAEEAALGAARALEASDLHHRAGLPLANDLLTIAVRVRERLSDPSPRVTALLELAEAAEEWYRLVHEIAKSEDPSPELLYARREQSALLLAKVDRYREVTQETQARKEPTT